VVAGLVAYANSFHGTLVLDDHPTIEANPSIRTLNPAAIFAPPAQVGTAGRPFANLTFALNYAFGGADVVGYHAVNLAIHLGTALLLFGVIRRALGRCDARVSRAMELRCPHRGRAMSAVRTPRLQFIAGDSVGLAVAVLWTVHPLGTQSVTYLSQRTELLAAAGTVALLYCFLRYVDSLRWGWLVLGWLGLAVAVASKEPAAVAPVVVFLFDAVFVAGGMAAWRQRWKWYVALAGCWALLGALIVHADLAARGVGLNQRISAGHYALIECRALLTYLRLGAWPHPLVFDYGWAPSVSVAAVAVILALLGLAFWAAWRGFAIGWLVLIWFVLLAPTSSVVPIAEQPIAENRAYLTNALVVTIAVCAAYRVVGRRTLALAATAALALIALTAARNRYYGSESALWRDTVAKRPDNARAWSALGLLEYKAGNAEAAIAHHERAIALRPTYAEAEGNLGADLLLVKRPVEAVTHFRRALEIEPALPGGASNLCQALLAAGNARLFAHDLTSAISAYEEALRLDPHFAFAHNNLASTLLQLGRFEDSLSHATAALALDPNYAAAHGTAATDLLQLGRYDEAITQFRAALALEPSAPSHTGLGLAYARKGDGDAAVSEFREALKLNPNFAPAQQALTELGM